MSAGGSYSATYRYSFDVYRMLMRGVRERNGWWLWKRILACEVLMAMAILVVVTLEKRPTTVGNALMSAEAGLIIVSAALALALFVMAIDFVFDRYVSRIVFRRSSAADTNVTVQMNDGGLKCSREGIVSDVAWSATKKFTVLRDRAACILWFGKREGLVIPSKAFASVQEFDAACNFMKGKVGVP
jgi:hypothetical protein